MTAPVRQPQRWIITGRRGAGKTTFCQHLAARARAWSWDVAGLLSPACLEEGHKIAIAALDLRRGESRILAGTVPHEGALRLGMWWFERETLAWGNEVLAQASPCDLLIVDEIGPLELELGLGWTTALEVLSDRAYRVAVAVVRPELVPRFQARWAGGRLLVIDSPLQARELADGWSPERGFPSEPLAGCFLLCL